jgi:hypothetical protein
MVRSTSSLKPALDGAAPANPGRQILLFHADLISQAEFVAHGALMGRASDKSQIF